MDHDELTKALELCGVASEDSQESRLMTVLKTILRLQKASPVPLTFGQIYERIQKDEPIAKLTKAWIHRVLKQLLEAQLVRVENPTSHRKKYIADVNTVMAGLERLKSGKVELLEQQSNAILKELLQVKALDCGHIAKEFVKDITGREEEISSRIVRGLDELDRVLRFNMFDRAGEGDIIRATLLYVGSFIDDTAQERTMKFIEAAERGADVRYLVTTEIFSAGLQEEKRVQFEKMMGLMNIIIDLRKRGKKFDARLYQGPKTYNQISINNESMALIIAENPPTATWVTRQFNPDLIDNAVKTFDRDWEVGKSILSFTSEDFEVFGVPPDGLIRKMIQHDSTDKS